MNLDEQIGHALGQACNDVERLEQSGKRIVRTDCGIDGQLCNFAHSAADFPDRIDLLAVQSVCEQAASVVEANRGGGDRLLSVQSHNGDVAPIDFGVHAVRKEAARRVHTLDELRGLAFECVATVGDPDLMAVALEGEPMQLVQDIVGLRARGSGWCSLAEVAPR